MSMNMLDCWVEHVLLGFLNMSLMNPSLVVRRRGKGKVGKVINWLLIHRYVFFSSPIFFRSYLILLVLLTMVQNCIHCKLKSQLKI